MPAPEIGFTPVVTAAGFAAALAAEVGGFAVDITHVAVGDNGYAVAVDGTGKATQTALVAEQDRVAIQDANEVGGGQTDIAFVIGGAGEYYIREIGFFLADGTLFAIASHPTQALMWKSAITQAAIALELVLEAVNPDSINIVSTGPPLQLLVDPIIDAAIAAVIPLPLDEERVLGRGVGAGAGNPNALTPTALTALIVKATSAEAQALTNTDNVMTPYRTGQAITAALGPAIAAAAAGSIGSLAFASKKTGGNIEFGSTAAGADLQPVSVGKMSGSGDNARYYGSALRLTGTWECLGYQGSSSSSGSEGTGTLWKRIL